MAISIKFSLSHTIFVVFLVIMRYIEFVNSLQEIVTYIDRRNCSDDQYFDVQSFSCLGCGLGFVKSKDGLACECPSIKRISSSLGGHSSQFCLPCKPNEYVSKCQSTCVPRKCLKNINGKISCSICKKDQIIVTHATNGSILPTIQCVSCASGSVPSDDRTFCRPCSLKMQNVNGTICQCDSKNFAVIENICVPNEYLKKTSTTLKVDSSFKSDFYERNWVLSNYLCSLRNKTACQMVANMCVLSLYKTGEDYPCSKWKSQKTSGSSVFIPELMYGEDEAYSILLRKKIPVVYSLNERSEDSYLDIRGIKISLEGSVREITEIKSSWLLACPAIWKLTESHLFKFAENYRYKCKIGAYQLVSMAETAFFEPHLHYVDKEKPGYKLNYAIPVLLRGYLIDFNKDNDINTWQLVRRYYIFDKTTGVEKYPNGTEILKYFRYARKIHVNIRIRRKGRDERNKIYPPLFIVEYGEITEEDMKQNKDVDLEFAINYELDGGSMIHGIEIAVGTLSAFATLYSILQSWSQSRRSGKFGFELYTILQFFIFVSGNLSNIFFIVAFGASTYSFILFKTQKSVYAVPPPERDEYVIQCYVIVAFSLKIVEVLAVNWRQITLDVCFIDWEKPTLPVNELEIRGINATAEPKLSFWRPYFIANEWNEIQTLRKVCLPSHLVACVFVIEIFGTSSWVNIGTEFSTEHSSGYITSTVYQFALGSLVFLVLYFIQLSFGVFIYERYIKNFIQDFMDICSISNVSMLLLDSQLHGYYLHGRCVHAACDTDGRGLLQGLPYTAFVIRCTSEFRLYYSRLSIHMISRDIKWQWQHHLAVGKNQANITSSTLTGIQGARKSANRSARKDDGDSRISELLSTLPPALERREQASKMINKFLIAFFDHALEDLDYEVREKRWVERLFDMELINESSNKSLLLYNTTGDPQSFQRTIWYGQEWTLATFDLYLFCFVQMMSGNYILAALMTAIVWKILSMCRSYGGKYNLAKKTLIDERFLV